MTGAILIGDNLTEEILTGGILGWIPNNDQSETEIKGLITDDLHLNQVSCQKLITSSSEYLFAS